jgi:mono/diheme cytochrome c family protein
MRPTTSFTVISSVLLALALTGPIFAQPAQDSGTIDFGRDVQPLFKTHCIDCHGQNQQMNGFRLDRRSDARKGGTVSVIGRGNSAAS